MCAQHWQTPNLLQHPVTGSSQWRPDIQHRAGSASFTTATNIAWVLQPGIISVAGTPQDWWGSASAPLALRRFRLDGPTEQGACALPRQRVLEHRGELAVEHRVEAAHHALINLRNVQNPRSCTWQTCRQGSRARLKSRVQQHWRNGTRQLSQDANINLLQLVPDRRWTSAFHADQGYAHDRLP